MVPEINLLPKIDRLSTGKRWLSIILALSFALILIILVFQYFSLGKEVKGLKTEEELLQAENTELAILLATLDQPVQVDLATSVKFIDSISYPVSPLLEEINSYVGPNTYLRDYVFSENTIEFTIDFETMTDVVTYVGDLAESPYIEDVKVEQISAFNPAATPLGEDEVEKTDVFEEVERYANTFTVVIDADYLRLGGEVQ